MNHPSFKFPPFCTRPARPGPVIHLLAAMLMLIHGCDKPAPQTPKPAENPKPPAPAAAQPAAPGTALPSAAAIEAVPEDQLQRFEFTRPLMGTQFAIVLYAPSEAIASQAALAAFDRIAALNKVYSDYDPASELSLLSASSGSGRLVPVSQDMWVMLSRSLEYSRKSDGAFDITVGPAVSLWRTARKQAKLPPPDGIQAALASMGFNLIELDEKARAARLTKPGMKLDLGGIAKGHACDEALKVLREKGIRRALIDGGGGSTLGDPPPGKKFWRVKIAPLPDDPASSARYLGLANEAVATSGYAYQHVTIDGVVYSHIVNPKTGVGLTELSAATVIAPDGAAADALATACCVMGAEKAMTMLRDFPLIKASMTVKTAGVSKLHQTPDFDSRLINPTEP